MIRRQQEKDGSKGTRHSISISLWFPGDLIVQRYNRRLLRRIQGVLGIVDSTDWPSLEVLSIAL
jgi:hypothetical protein